MHALVHACLHQVYVTGPQASATSDQVFYTKHIDGPYAWFPFCSVYRIIVGMDANQEFSTHFPMQPKSLTLGRGDACCFDFNRELHYITQVGSECVAYMRVGMGGGERNLCRIHVLV